MNNAARIAEIVLPVIVSLFLGWLSRLKNILSRAQIDGLKTFVVTFSLPAVLFMAFAEIAYGLDVLLTCVAVFAACTAMLFLGKLFRRENPLMAFLVTGFEAGMMGYSLYTLLFGAEKPQRHGHGGAGRRCVRLHALHGHAQEPRRHARQADRP